MLGSAPWESSTDTTSGLLARTAVKRAVLPSRFRMSGLTRPSSSAATTPVCPRYDAMYRGNAPMGPPPMEGSHFAPIRTRTIGSSPRSHARNNGVVWPSKKGSSGRAPNRSSCSASSASAARTACSSGVCPSELGMWTRGNRFIRSPTSSPAHSWNLRSLAASPSSVSQPREVPSSRKLCRASSRLSSRTTSGRRPARRRTSSPCSASTRAGCP
mmetsp:Transcript_8287/g.23089  ORF Transcript_8287/g.23089 Transcript_8287/m.23089 type:complete len:214 (-) Transcript_8287:60-701(-)